MNTHKIRLVCGLALAFLTANINISTAANFGFCTDAVNRANVFRVGTTEKQGLAIRFSAEKLANLKGCTISSISAAFGSKRMTGGTVNLFIATTLNSQASPLREFTGVVSSAVSWQDFSLDEPYTITGEEPCLYIGYTGEISTLSTMLMADFTADSKGCSFAYKDGEWTDMYGMGYGNASIRVGIDNAPTLNDLMIKPLQVEGYFKAGQEYSLSGQLFNCGNTTINSFKLTVNSLSSREDSGESVRNISIAPMETYDFTLPAWHSDSEGTMPLDLQVTSVNDTNDNDITDNVFSQNVFYYPEAMERAILLEGFTGQNCSNCPGGHAKIAEFLTNISREESTPVIEIMHHSGYQPDCFSMDSDYDYTYFYGSSSTFAPAVMLNRTPTIEAVPVMNVGETYLATAYSMLENTQPYASLSLESKYNPENRELQIAFSSFAHTDMPSEQNVFNVMLVQDSLVSYQLPYGNGYTHNAVFRGVLTRNSWGRLLPESATKANGTHTWTLTTTLPEAIFSDYYDKETLSEETAAYYTWSAIPENMHLVAMVGAYGNSPTNNQIYNAIEVKLGESHTQAAFSTAIETLNHEATQPHIAVKDGRIQVKGDYDSLHIYSSDGRSLKADAKLNSGIYIVRIAQKGKTNTVKIQIR